MALIEHELVSVFGESAGDSSPVFAEQAEEELARRQERVARRELDATAAEEQLRAWNQRLRTCEVELETREQRSELSAKMSPRPREMPNKVGRNERCPCGSGLKYKQCHGLLGRWQTALPDHGLLLPSEGTAQVSPLTSRLAGERYALSNHQPPPTRACTAALGRCR
jgi:hypothetical protein